MPELYELLNQILQGFRKKEVSIHPLPPILRILVRDYAKWQGVGQACDDAHAYRDLARALRDVWFKHSVPQFQPGETLDKLAERWLVALIVMVYYLEPTARGQDLPDRVYVAQALNDPAWIKGWIEENVQIDELTEIDELAARVAARAQIFLYEDRGFDQDNYRYWRNKSVEYLGQSVSLAARDLLKEQKQIAASLPVSALPDVFQTGSYVHRARAFDELKAWVLKAQEVSIWVALMGSAGIGKTTLLQALIRDDDVLTQFYDRIFWFEIGIDLEPLALTQKVGTALGKSLSSRIERVEDAQRELGDFLVRQPTLVILDNVFDLEVVEALLGLPPEVTVVYSTRNREIAFDLTRLSEGRIELDEMTESEAWELITRLSGDVPDGQEQAVREVLGLLEYHPLALTVATGLAQQSAPVNWPAVEQAIRSAEARLEVFASRDDERWNAWLSLEAELQTMDEELAKYWLILGRVPFLARLGARAGAAIWSVSGDKASLIWQKLAARHLAQALEEEIGYYQLHWLVQDFVRCKSDEWNRLQRFWRGFWEWRYHPERALRWWWFSIPPPPEAHPFRQWLPEIFKLGSVRGWITGALAVAFVSSFVTTTWYFVVYGRVSLVVWLFSQIGLVCVFVGFGLEYLTNTIWKREGHGLRLLADAEEWAVTMILTLRFSCLTILMTVGGMILFLFVPKMGLGCIGILICVILLLIWFLIVATVDFVNILRWRASGHSFTEAWYDKD